ncbi:MAG: DUF2970 domain-containing protein [Methylophilaceae bacterium]
MKIFSIIQSVLAAFFGVQSNKNLKKDGGFIEKNGFKYFLIVGFIITLILSILLFAVVSFIIDKSA